MGKVKDMTGQRFGKLTVLERDYVKHGKSTQASWKCLCDCGRITSVTGYELRSGNTTSCGCSRGKPAEDLTGKVFGKLTVLERDYVYGDTKWLCRCECGRIVSVKASALRSGNTKTCGSKGCKCREYKDLTGKRFGSLVVVGIDALASSKLNGIVWICSCDCGNITSVQASHLVAGNVHSCGCSSMSLGALTIREYLDEHGIHYIPEHHFNDLRSDKGSFLWFDFYLPEHNMCIEYDGRQHFEPIDFFGGMETFKRTQLNDALKNKYCRENNIKLLRISYLTTYREIPSLLDENIQESRNDHSLGGNDQAYADNSPTLVS